MTLEDEILKRLYTHFQPIETKLLADEFSIPETDVIKALINIENIYPMWVSRKLGNVGEYCIYIHTKGHAGNVKTFLASGGFEKLKRQKQLAAQQAAEKERLEQQSLKSGIWSNKWTVWISIASALIALLSLAMSIIAINKKP